MIDAVHDERVTQDTDGSAVRLTVHPVAYG
jgi:hypothetical protein